MNRNAMMDSLRGFCLFGLLLVHAEEQFGLYWGVPHGFSLLQKLIFILLSGKMFSVLAVCFGFSLSHMHAVALKRGERFAVRYAWRMLILGGIGWLHSLLYSGDILSVLAVLGILMIPLVRVRSTLLMWIAACCFAQPYLLWNMAVAAPVIHNPDPTMMVYLHGSFLDVVRVNLWQGQVRKWDFLFTSGRLLQLPALAITGLVGARHRFFHDLPRFASFRRKALIIIGLSVLLLLACYLEAGSFFGSKFSSAPIYARMILAGWLDILCSAIIVLLFIGVWESRLRKMVAMCATAGRMTLTLYIGQSIIFIPLLFAFGLHLYSKLSEVEAAELALAVFALQLAASIAWHNAFHHGPLEWLWRAGTSLSVRIPFRRSPGKAMATADSWQASAR